MGNYVHRISYVLKYSHMIYFFGMPAVLIGTSNTIHLH